MFALKARTKQQRPSDSITSEKGSPTGNYVCINRKINTAMHSLQVNVVWTLTSSVFY